MSDFLNSFLIQLGGGAIIISGLSAWLGNVWRDRISSKEKAAIEIEMEKLKAEHARQTQHLEHKLQSERYLTQLAQTKLMEKRATVVDEIYKSLVRLHNAIYDTIRPDFFGRAKPSPQEAYESALIKIDEFIEDYEKNKIYFSKDTAEKISNFHVIAAQTLDQARITKNSGEQLGRGETPNLQKLFEKVNYEMQEPRKAVEQEFRKIMHVQQPETHFMNS